MQHPSRPPNGFLVGVTASWQSGRYRQLLIHAALIFCATTAFAALLPSLVHDVLHANAREFGALMGALGGGAILAPALLPALRRRLSQRALLAGALLIYGAMMGLLGITEPLMLRVLLIGCGGVAWSIIVTSLNGAAFGAFPSSVRARTLSIYMLMIAAGQTAGGALWGQLAIRYGVGVVMTGAGVSVMLSAIAILASADFLE